MLACKLGGIGCVFLCICTAGFLYSCRYSARSRELMRAVAIVNALHHRLTFTLDTPYSLFLWLEKSATLCCDYVETTCRLTEQGMNFRVAFEQALQSSRLPILPEDKQILSELADILGASDLETQQMRLLLLSDSLKQLQTRSERDEGTKKKLAQTLSVLCGLAISIFLI